MYLIQKTFKVGERVWHCLNKYNPSNWRYGEVTSVQTTGWPYVYIKPIGVKGTERQEHDVPKVIPALAIQSIPLGTSYLLQTDIGKQLCDCINGYFTIFRCSSKIDTYTTKGLGYVIVPRLSNIHNDYKMPSWKTWTINPSPLELLSFLHSNFTNILGVHHKVKEEYESQSKKVKSMC